VQDACAKTSRTRFADAVNADDAETVAAPGFTRDADALADAEQDTCAAAEIMDSADADVVADADKFAEISTKAIPPSSARGAEANGAKPSISYSCPSDRSVARSGCCVRLR